MNNASESDTRASEAGGQSSAWHLVSLAMLSMAKCPPSLPCLLSFFPSSSSTTGCVHWPPLLVTPHFSAGRQGGAQGARAPRSSAGGQWASQPALAQPRKVAVLHAALSPQLDGCAGRWAGSQQLGKRTTSQRGGMRPQAGKQASSSRDGSSNTTATQRQRQQHRQPRRDETRRLADTAARQATGRLWRRANARPPRRPRHLLPPFPASCIRRLGASVAASQLRH